MTDTADAEPDGASPPETGKDKAPGDSRRPRRSWRRTVLETVALILVALLLAAGIRTFVAETFYIPSASMVPTLHVYDRIAVQKAFFSWHDVRQGDIVVFSHPPLDKCGGNQHDDLVKRVIALPGQTIYSSAGRVYVNGKPLAEPYLPAVDPLGKPIPDATRQHPYRVPAGEFYLLGDNRDISCDSRYWGPVQGSAIVGKVVLTWWSGGRPAFRWF